jgi:opacity protein-like surface antigen
MHTMLRGAIAARRALRRGPLTALFAALLLALVPSRADAQGSRDYLFGTPAGSLTIRGGLNLLRQSSAVFEDSREFLTLDRGDLVGGSVLADLAFRVNERFDVVLSGGYSHSSAWSEFRGWEGDDDLPIAQRTKLTTVPLSASVKVYPRERGRAIGRFAYVPSRFAPYVGVGAGAMWHRYVQNGEFVDFATIDDEGYADIIRIHLENDGFAPLLQGLAGVDIRLTRQLSLSLEGRYQWARGRMNPEQFEGFDRIDLSGLQTTAGLHIRL